MLILLLDLQSQICMALTSPVNFSFQENVNYLHERWIREMEQCA